MDIGVLSALSRSAPCPRSLQVKVLEVVHVGLGHAMRVDLDVVEGIGNAGED